MAAAKISASRLAQAITAIAIAIAAGTGIAVAQSGTDTGDIVEMEAFEVSANRYSWRFARMGEFEILCSLDNDKMAAAIIQNALRIIETLKARSALFDMKLEMPARIILIQDMNLEKFIKSIDEKSGQKIEERAQMPSQKIARPEVQGEKKLSYSPKSHVSSLTRLNSERAQIILHVPKAYKGRANHYYPTSILVDAYLRLCLNGKNIRQENLVYFFANSKIMTLDARERGVMRRDETQIITDDNGWFLAQKDGVLIRRYDYKRERVVFQGASTDFDRTKASALSQFMMGGPRLGLRDVLEFPEMFRTTYDGSDTMQTVENYLTYKRQIADFSLYCIFSPDAAVRDGYVKLSNALKKQPLDEALFKKCFNTDYEDFHDKMYSHWRLLGPDNHTGKANLWGVASFTVPAPAVKVGFRDAGRVERARMFADWFLACGTPHLAGEMLAGAARRDARAFDDAEFLAARGLFEARHGDKKAAPALLEKAFALGTARPDALRELARVRRREIEERAPGGGLHRFSAEETWRVVEPLDAALRLSPGSVKTLALLAIAWSLGDARPPEETLRALADALAKSPKDSPLAKAVSPLLRKHGFRPESATGTTPQQSSGTSTEAMPQDEVELTRK
ncbi:MAG: hypothetical protein LBM04_13250 [Opitutaceae bacterium]|jgi:hypothetical protein|nr:hypothetical protein [Opitutaceae bacterium]